MHPAPPVRHCRPRHHPPLRVRAPHLGHACARASFRRHEAVRTGLPSGFRSPPHRRPFPSAALTCAELLQLAGVSLRIGLIGPAIRGKEREFPAPFGWLRRPASLGHTRLRRGALPDVALSARSRELPPRLAGRPVPQAPLLRRPAQLLLRRRPGSQPLAALLPSPRERPEEALRNGMAARKDRRPS